MQKTLILVGGWTRDKRSYKKIIKFCPEDWRVIVFPYKDFIIPELNDQCAEKLLQIVNRQEKGKIYLAGHSLGGEPCIEFASEYPDKIDRLILIDSCGIRESMTTWRILKNFVSTQLIFGIFKLREDILSFFDFIKHPIYYIKLGLHFYSLDLSNRISTITTDTLIFWGEKDHLVTYGQAFGLHKLIENSKFLRLKKADHDWILHSPKLFWEQIDKFGQFEEIPSSSTIVEPANY